MVRNETGKQIVWNSIHNRPERVYSVLNIKPAAYLLKYTHN